MAIPYQIIREDKENDQPTSVQVFVGGKLQLIDSQHANFKEIIALLLSSGGNIAESEVAPLFNLPLMIGQKFEKLSPRISVSGEKVYYDLVEVDTALTKAILAFLTERKKDWEPLVKFMEKVQTNENPHSVEHAYRWLNRHNFTIDKDGDIIAYKGLTSEYMSKHSGRAIVDGVVVEGQIPNRPGSVIEMPRDEVVFDPNNGCAVGLHAANFSFAKSWGSGGRVVSLKINPQDIVSVPTESGDQKMRVCRYIVGDDIASEIPTILAETPEPEPESAPETVSGLVKVIRGALDTVRGRWNNE